MAGRCFTICVTREVQKETRANQTYEQAGALTKSESIDTAKAMRERKGTKKTVGKPDGSRKRSKDTKRSRDQDY